MRIYFHTFFFCISQAIQNINKYSQFIVFKLSVIHVHTCGCTSRASDVGRWGGELLKTAFQPHGHRKGGEKFQQEAAASLAATTAASGKEEKERQSC